MFYHECYKKNKTNNYTISFFVGTSVTALLFFKFSNYKKNVASNQSFGESKANLPFYTVQEVAEHCTK